MNDILINYLSALVSACRNWRDFSGRATRSEFWCFAATIYVLLYTVQYLVKIAHSFVLAHKEGLRSVEEYRVLGLITALAAIVIMVVFIFWFFVANLSITIRRLHDTGKSGWYFFLNFVPIVGPFIVLFLCAIKGNQGFNEYGPDPLDVSKYDRI